MEEIQLLVGRSYSYLCLELEEAVYKIMKIEKRRRGEPERRCHHSPPARVVSPDRESGRD